MTPPDHSLVPSDERVARMKAWMRHWIFPPRLWETVRRTMPLYRAANRALSPPEHATPLLNILFPHAGGELYWMPVEKIVNRHGQSFTTEQNHYSRYLESGFDDLANFFRLHRPETAAQAKFINETLTGQAGTGVGDAPWLRVPLPGTATPGREPESFGPVSDLELAAEAARLDKLRLSIEKNGFLAEHASGEQIGCQILYKDNDDFRIVIHNGNHRTAVLAHLGWKLIPVQPWVIYNPLRLSDLAHWPGVVDGRFTEETAHAMFEAFFRPRHRQLLPGW